MESIDALEAARPGRPFTYAHEGEVHTAPDPVELPWKTIVGAIQQERLPGTPPMPLWKSKRLLAAWVAHHDLPSFDSMRRLLYLLDRYRDMLEYDLLAHLNGADLGELWQSRQWRKLLNLIDRLPRHSYYSEAVSNDEEHAEMLAEAMANSGDGEGGPSGPPMHSWSPEVAALTDLLDAVRGVSYTLAAINSPKDKAPTPPKPSLRPVTALEAAQKRAAHRKRLEAHKRLTARMLPHKAD